MSSFWDRGGPLMYLLSKCRFKWQPQIKFYHDGSVQRSKDCFFTFSLHRLLSRPTKSPSRSRGSRVVSGRERWKHERGLQRSEFVVLGYRRHSLVLSKRFRWRRDQIVMKIGKYPATPQQPYSQSQTSPRAKLGHDNIQSGSGPNKQVVVVLRDKI